LDGFTEYERLMVGTHEESEDVAKAWRELLLVRGGESFPLTLENGNYLASLHKVICGTRKDLLPDRCAGLRYWDMPFTENQHSTYTKEIGNGLCVSSTIIRHVPVATRAIVIDLAARIYSTHNLKFGQRSHSVASNDNQLANNLSGKLERELLNSMTDGFDENYVMVFVTRLNQNARVLCGSTGVIKGSGHQSIIDTIGTSATYSNAASTLPTNKSITYQLTPAAYNLMATLAESNVSEITRLYIVGDNAVSPDVYIDIMKAMYMAMPPIVLQFHRSQMFIFNTKHRLSEK